jgi:hypothetical protein
MSKLRIHSTRKDSAPQSRTYARENNIEIIEEFTDGGKSGLMTRRGSGG